jgi:hypothetical protein
MPLKHLLHVKAFFMRLRIHLKKTPIQNNPTVDINNGMRSHESSLQKLRINLPKPSSEGWDHNYPSLETQHLKAEQEDLETIRKLLKQDLPRAATEVMNDSIDSIMTTKPIIQPMSIQTNPHPQKNN